MSKISKLIKNPKLYFKDALLKYGFLKQKKANSINIFESYSACLHIGEKGINAISYVKIWFDYFMASEIKFIILVRDNKTFELLSKEFSKAHIIYADNFNDIKSLFDTFFTIKVCYYPSNTGNNFDLLRYTKIRHIFIGHGDSDKASSVRKFFRAYDENWVSGNAHIDRIKNEGFNLNGLEHVMVGRPTLYQLIKQNQLNWYNRFNGDFNLLYLPTWEGFYEEQNYSSLDCIIDNIQSLKIYNLNISLKLHPNTGKGDRRFLNIDKKLSSISSLNLISKEQQLQSFISQSNLFICDISAVVTECLSVNAPIFLYIPKNKDIKIAKSNIDYEEYCYIFSCADELVNLIRDVLSGNDYLANGRKKAQDYIINIKDTMKQTFINKLKEESQK